MGHPLPSIITARAPGKIIISGEHAVIYGYPALVTTVNLYLTATLRNSAVTTQSDIPIGCGLGSSAALAATKAALALKKINLRRINQLAFEQEKQFHSRPSGVDNTAVVYGGWLKFQRPNEITRLKPLKFPDCLLINTGQPSETTAEMIDYVRQQNHAIFPQIAACTNGIINHFSQLNSLLHTNELLLEKLGTVSPSTKKLIRAIEQSGGVAKVCGAGGRKTASGILLCLHHQPQKLISLAKKFSLDYFYPVKLGVPGISLRIQSTLQARNHLPS